MTGKKGISVEDIESDAVILVIPPAVDKDTMVFHLPGDGGCGAIQYLCDVSKRLFMNQGALDEGTLRKR